MSFKKLNIQQALLISMIIVSGCSSSDSDPNVPNSSWEIIQSKIFDPNCGVCHTPGTSFARQTDLILTGEEGYYNLIDKTPVNTAAQADGLKLLETNGLESLYKSFLWEKINAPDQEHFYSDHPGYGSLMPLGLPPLTNGELEYIRQWIVAGAPREGFVVDEAVLEDDSRFELNDQEFAPLPVPESGIQLHLGPFEIQPDFERELFQYQALNNDEDIYLNRIEITMRAGSHHFILYDFEPGTVPPPLNEIRDVRDENNQFITATLQTMINQVFVFGTQVRVSDYSYPPGVALRIRANESLDLNSHYVNYGTEPMTGEVYTNLHTVDVSEVQHVAENLFLSKQNFSLPPNQETTLISHYTFSERRHIFLLSSHAHQFMKEFRIFIKGGDRDGELVYYTNDWEHPVLLNFDPPITLEAGEGLTAEAIYDNTTNRTLGFGLLSTDEMMIIFGSYYTD